VKLFQWKSLGIKTRLIIVSVVPVCLLFLAVITYSYFSRHAQVETELTERGYLIASALAETGEYGITSGNMAYLERTIHGLFTFDPGILQVDILNVQKNILLSIKNTKQQPYSPHMFEVAIKRPKILIDTFSNTDELHVTSQNQPAAKQEFAEIIGYARIALSPITTLIKQRNRIIFETSVAAVVLFFSLTLGLLLSISLTKPLAKTISVVRQIRKGNYGGHFDEIAGGEIGDLQSAIIEMRSSLNTLKNELENKVTSRTHDLKIARDQALKSNEEKRRLIKKINTVIEEERKSISVEVHDHLNASLIVTRLEAQNIYDLAEDISSSHAADEIKKKATSIIQLSNELYASSRNMIKRLRPEIIDMLGLREAVEEMVNHYASVNSSCRFNLYAKDDFSILSSDLAITAYRLIQESLLNIVKHAEARKVVIRIKFTNNNETLLIYVSDDGKGFSPNAEAPGIGLIGMKERVASFNGKLKISSTSTKGSRILIAIKIH